jgi:probable O-glycosylation ligase (exosortase A-associated)
MRDLSLLILLLTLIWLAWRQPWMGVLGLTLLSAMHPQTYWGESMSQFPVYKALFLATCLSVAIDYWRTRKRPALFWDWRFLVLALLYLDFALTTRFALLPDTAAIRLLEISYLFPPLLLALLLIDTREKFNYLIVVAAAGVALVALKGGYWAIMTGFQDRVYGPPGSQIGGNNEFAVALAMTIPLLALWLRQTAGRRLRLIILAAIALCYIAALTSWSRGGLVSLAAMTALLVWNSRRKYLAIPLLALGLALAFVSLPEKWFGRMETLSSYRQDQSFQGREQVWRKGLAFVQTDLWTGSGFEGWRLINAQIKGDTLTARDWHSAYVEILVEHGIPGFLLWSVLFAGTLLSLSRMIGRGKRLGLPWITDYGAMLRASLVAFAVGGLTLGITYWEMLVLFLGFAMIASRLARDPVILKTAIHSPQRHRGTEKFEIRG